MPIVTGLAIYFVLWWLLLFVILPLEIRGQHEDGEVVKGTDPGAPIMPRLKKKAMQTSVLAAVVWLIIFVILKFELITLADLDFLPNFVPEYAR